MVERFHGIDRHRRASTVSVLNRDGIEEKLIGSIRDFNANIETLGPEDAVVMETGTGAFFWADAIEARGAQCFIIDPYRFRIIKDSEEQDGQAGFEEYVQSAVGVYGHWRVWTSSGA